MKVLRLDSCRAFVLLNPPPNALGRLLFIGVLGWVSDTWRSPIGDTSQHPIGLRRATYVIAYTRQCVIGFLHAFDATISMTLGKFLLVSE